MHKIADFINLHETTGLVQDAVYEKAWINTSRVIALPGSERSVRGYSDPRFIIFDEAARIEDATYKAAIPMTAGGNTEIIALTTPWGKRGWFWRAWTGKGSQRWEKIMITTRWILNETEDDLIEGPPEEEMRKRYAKEGVKFFYSPRHTREFCLDMLKEIGPLWYRQEYMCEFIDLITGLFSEDVVNAAVSENAELMDFSGGEGLNENAEVLSWNT